MREAESTFMEQYREKVKELLDSAPDKMKAIRTQAIELLASNIRKIEDETLRQEVETWLKDSHEILLVSKESGAKKVRDLVVLAKNRQTYNTLVKFFERTLSSMGWEKVNQQSIWASLVVIPGGLAALGLASITPVGVSLLLGVEGIQQVLEEVSPKPRSVDYARMG